MVVAANKPQSRALELHVMLEEETVTITEIVLEISCVELTTVPQFIQTLHTTLAALGIAVYNPRNDDC